jgi:hypothetical protein
MIDLNANPLEQPLMDRKLDREKLDFPSDLPALALRLPLGEWYRGKERIPYLNRVGRAGPADHGGGQDERRNQFS